ncbi:hypothetical protein ACFY1L_28635 [Streptomyces sp. NPDC001663]|uniref:hypothetical protein n=1 Tax=Streptomyces sp. NPDC001663 TaxID=3364597 RepID=UPI003693B486
MTGRRVAVVTGAATVRRLARDGWAVAADIRDRRISPRGRLSPPVTTPAEAGR